MRTLRREVPLADGRVRHVAVVMDDDDQDGRDRRRQPFLQFLADNETVLLRPGGGAFETTRIWHDGMRWCAEAEATGKKES